MTDQTRNDLEEPDRIRTPEGERADGRPTEGTLDERRAQDPSGDHPTVAPEETGGSPSTEHAPGGDL